MLLLQRGLEAVSSIFRKMAALQKKTLPSVGAFITHKFAFRVFVNVHKCFLYV